MVNSQALDSVSLSETADALVTLLRGPPKPECASLNVIIRCRACHRVTWW